MSGDLFGYGRGKAAEEMTFKLGREEKGGKAYYSVNRGQEARS